MKPGYFTSYAETRDYLYGLKHRGAFYGIDRMRVFTERLGSPQLRYPTVHIAGTNGKGSTCAMVEAILRGHGLKTGLFTSPHLIHQGERVQVNRMNLSHEAIVDYVNQLRPVAEKMENDFPDMHPTFFEFMTGMAFLRFLEAEVDVGIIETGLGGRLDATNVLTPDVCAITSIGLDHTEILGDTYAQIAREKAGILKAGVPVVLGILPEEGEKVIREIAQDKGCPVLSVRDTFGDDLRLYPKTNLRGDFQRRNAGVAWLIAQVLQKRFVLDGNKITQALSDVDWAGRWDERKIGDRRFIFDATHNPEGAIELEKNLADFVAESGFKPIIVTGTLGEARAHAIMPMLSRYAKTIYLVRPKQPRACELALLRNLIPADFKGEIIDSSVESLFPDYHSITLPEGPNPILVTGSIYLIGEVLDALTQRKPAREEILQD